ncbi:MAG TPA: 4-(cytidine 5'-diphospho)-2-C-methyl-D-erythritol kinase [Dehalococcoidales bacterium]
MMTATAPAKLNLTLEVLNKRPDGFHEIRSVVQTITFGDKLKISAGPRLEIKCNRPEWSAAKSLVSKAVSLLKNSTGTSQGAIIEIEKRIPVSSGLGGDSSDAAAVLRGLNMLWNLRLSLRDLISYAAQLGADVPLFLYGGTVLIEGKGEKIRPLHPMPHMTVVLFMPSIPTVENKTQKMYGQLSVRNYTPGRTTEDFTNMLEGKASKPGIGLFNVFDEVALKFFNGLKEAKQKFIEAGATEVHLAGSGPTLFTLTRDDLKADDIHQRLQRMKLEAYLADF